MSNESKYILQEIRNNSNNSSNTKTRFFGAPRDNFEAKSTFKTILTGINKRNLSRKNFNEIKLSIYQIKKYLSLLKSSNEQEKFKEIEPYYKSLKNISILMYRILLNIKERTTQLKKRDKRTGYTYERSLRLLSYFPNI